MITKNFIEKFLKFGSSFIAVYKALCEKYMSEVYLQHTRDSARFLFS